MRKETDLPKVKMIAHVLLDMPIAETSFSPAIVSHPFTSTGVTAAQNEDGNITVVDLLNNKEDYAKWKEMVGKQIDSAENACQVFFLLNKPYYLTFLKFSAPVLSQEDLGQLLAHAWILEECPNQDRNVSKRELLALFHSVPPELLMDEEEYAVYQSLEDPVTVYRGVTSYNAKNIKALSWTLDRDTIRGVHCGGAKRPTLGRGGVPGSWRTLPGGTFHFKGVPHRPGIGWLGRGHGSGTNPCGRR